MIAEPTEIRPWILGWGKECAVVAPSALRDSIADELVRALLAYEPRESAEGRRRSPLRALASSENDSLAG